MKKCELYDRDCTNCGECEICDLDKTKKCNNCMMCVTNGKEFNSLHIDEIIRPEEHVKKSLK